MTRSTAFALGAAVAGAIAALVWRASIPPEPELQPVEYWQGRALDAERQLDAMRARLDSVASQLESLAARFDDISARLDALAQPAAQSAPADDPAAGASAAGQPAPATPEFQPVADEEWEALVGGALGSEIERRLGHALPPERQQRLLDALARVRDASALIKSTETDPTDTAPLRRQLTRTIVLMEADRVFREEMGIGVSEFLRGLDPDQVEDVATPGPTE